MTRHRTPTRVLAGAGTIALTTAWAAHAFQPAATASGPATRPASEPPVVYDDWFTPEALRVDLFHTGTSVENSYALDEVVVEPVWPGTHRYLIDPFGYGTWRVRVFDAASRREIFRQGYATLFDEWTGTEEARAGFRRSMSESVRFPMPRKPVLVQLDHRNPGKDFHQVVTIPIDPASYMIDRARPFEGLEVKELGGDAPPDKAMDVLIVPEGYTVADRAKLEADLKRFARVFLSYEPWKSNQGRIHMRGVLAWSRQSGVTEPRKGIYRDTILGSTFNTFDSPRYLTVLHTKRLRQIASLAPYDTLFVMVNTSRYGGGGIYNQWSIFTSDNEYDDYLMLHEYGHHMGGLGDEYYTSSVASDEEAMYPRGTEPWEPNLTALLDGTRQSAKWKSLIAPDTPVPTPDEPRYAAVIGAFEGAGYKAKGLYRPARDCKMFHKGLVEFCAVCRRSLESMVRYYTGEEFVP